MSIVTVIFMYALWTSVFPLCKIALQVAPPLFLTASRMLLAALILLGYLALRNRKAFKVTGKQFFAICMLAMFQIYLTNALEAWSLQHLTAAKTCFIYSLGPFFTAFFSYLHFGEKMNRRKWLGLAIGFSGIIPVLSAQKGANELLSGISFISLPELAMIAASACTVYGWVLLRMILKNDEKTPIIFTNGACMLIGGLMALIHSLIVEKWTPLPVAPNAYLEFSQGILLMTLICNIICFNIYGAMLKRFTATFLSFMGLVSPIFASIISWLLLGEQPSFAILAATGIIAIGAWLVHSAELKQGYIANTASSATQ